MGTYILLLFFHVGPMGSTDSKTSTSIPNFKSEQDCIVAGELSKTLVQGTVKKVNYICLYQPK